MEGLMFLITLMYFMRQKSLHILLHNSIIVSDFLLCADGSMMLSNLVFIAIYVQ